MAAEKGQAHVYRKPALTVWRYDTPLGADAGAVRLTSLQERNALTVHDAITVAWMPGAHQPRIGHLRHATAGAAAGAGVAALAHRLRGTGIDEQFLRDVVAQLAPGSSALLVLSSDADLDQVRPVVERGVARGDVVLLHAQLADDAPATIRDVVDALTVRTSTRAPDPSRKEPR